MRQDPPKPRGRPPIPADDRVQVRSIRLTDEEWAKLRAIGMARLRAWLARVKP